jgi:hypothetical protein
MALALSAISKTSRNNSTTPSQRTVANQYEGEDELKQLVLGNREIE